MKINPTDARDEFLKTVRNALGKDDEISRNAHREQYSLSEKTKLVKTKSKNIERYIRKNNKDLLLEFMETAVQAGCKMAHVKTREEATQYIISITQTIKPKTVIRSTHSILETIEIDQALSNQGISTKILALESGLDTEKQNGERAILRQHAIKSDIGITGVDYAIAETGSCVLLAKPGTSRLVSLLPPVHIAVVLSNQILPSLDELFTLRSKNFLIGDFDRYMSIITGPSRSADIEQTIVTGVHGPGEVHIVLLE